jgi:hypothetical protein
MRRRLSGAFAATNLGNGAWRLTQSEPGGIDVYLKGAGADAGEVLRGATVSDIEIEWQPTSVSLNLTASGKSRRIETTSAIVHEPKPHLYDALPLAQFEPAARRFWRRVFRVVQIPGGRHLLGVLARRTRARQ